MLEAAGASPSLEQIIEAFLAPVLEADVSNAVPINRKSILKSGAVRGTDFSKALAPVARRFDKRSRGGCAGASGH